MKELKPKKGYAVLDDKGKILYINPYLVKPRWFYIGSWGYPVEGHKVVKVLITPLE